MHKVLPSTTLYYKACTKYFPYYKASTKYFPILFCTIKFAPSTSQYYFILQSFHKALPNISLYDKACARYLPVLPYITKLAQKIPVLFCTKKLVESTSQYHFVLQKLHKALPSTTLYYKACTKHFPTLLCKTKKACTILLRTTNLIGHYNAFYSITWFILTYMATENNNSYAAIPLRSATTDSTSA